MAKTGLPIFVNNSPSDRSDQIFWLVKNSQLNFCAQETPYSLNIQIKKKFVTPWKTDQTLQHAQYFENSEAKFEQQIEGSTDEARDEIRKFKVNIEKLETQKILIENHSKELEKKLQEAVRLISKSSSQTKDLTKALENEVENSKVLKSVINKKNIKADKLQHVICNSDKTIKAKDKLIYNLEKKTDNQIDSIKNVKVELDQLKAENKKSAKKLKQQYEKEKRIGIEADLENNELELCSVKEPVENNVDYEMLETMIDAHLKMVSKKFEDNTIEMCNKFDNFEYKIGNFGQGDFHTDVT